MKYYTCILCNKHPKLKERRRVNDSTAPILRRYFMIEDTVDKYICNKCAHKCYKIKNESSEIPRSPESVLSKRQRVSESMSSPPSVTLSIPRTSLGHSYCFVCKKPGPKLVVPASRLRFLAFIHSDIFIPSGVRCCAKHIENDTLNADAMAMLKSVKDQTAINRTGILELLREAKEVILERGNTRLDFDDPDNLSDEDYYNLMGISKSSFNNLMTFIGDVRSSKARSPRTCVALLLTKLRTSLNNSLLGTLFTMTKSQIRRAIATARESLESGFVPHHLGFAHISREEVIGTHTRPLAKDLFAKDVTKDQAILVLDGTYIYIQKSGNFTFQRRSFSLHKHRPLVKPMMIVTTTGYIIAVLGPYLADNKNNDANILKHMIGSNVQEMKNWLKENDVFVVDRGFRDSASVLDDLGIQMEMPSFLTKGMKQHPTEEANSSRLVTKIRWVVESVNGRIKTWRYLDRTLPNSQIPYIGHYVRIICAICNKYRNPLCSGDEVEDSNTAAKMLYLAKQSNLLKERVEQEELAKRKYSWRKIDAADCISVPDFPYLSEQDKRELTMGVYQLKMARSYTEEHLNENSGYEISISEDIQGLVSAKLQSRHISSKKYCCWIGYDDGVLTSWFCTCKSGARVVGACAHITSVIWYLSYARHLDTVPSGVEDWTNHLSDASHVPDLIDASDSDDNGTEE